MSRKPPHLPTRRRSRKGVSPPAPRGIAQLPARLRLVRRQHTLVYGVRLLPDRVLEEGPHEQVPLRRAGSGETLTLHQITGDFAEIRRKLLESLDAFFEIYGEPKD
jgi:hypothetical protein